MSRSDRTGTLMGPSSPRPILTGGSCATLSWISKWVHGGGAIRQDLPGEVRSAASVPAVPGQGHGPLAPPHPAPAGLGQCFPGRGREEGGTPRLCLFRDRACPHHLSTLMHESAASVALVLTPAGWPRPPTPVTLRGQELSAPLCRGGPGAMTRVKQTGRVYERRGRGQPGSQQRRVFPTVQNRGLLRVTAGEGPLRGAGLLTPTPPASVPPAGPVQKPPREGTSSRSSSGVHGVWSVLSV